jgi:hypothetical protein
MFKETKQPKKHQERFIRKLLGDDAYYQRWRRLKRIREEKKSMGIGYFIALSLFTVGVVIIAFCILLNNI